MEEFNVTPVYIEIPEEDPERTYDAVRGVNSYLLESCEGGEKIARYSFIGFNPAAKATYRNNKPGLEIYDKELKKLVLEESNPVDAIKGLLTQFRQIPANTPRFFGGLVGYFSYDINRYFNQLEGDTRDDLKHPDCEFILTKNNIIFDHIYKKTYLLRQQFTNTIDGREAMEDLRDIEDTIRNHRINEQEEGEEVGEASSNMSRQQYTEAVERIKEYIRAGDIFQAVLSQRLTADYRGDEFRVYQRLKEINPSPYMYILDLGERRIVGSSPEMLVRVEERRVETYPIAGTRPRGGTPKEDERLGRELLGDEKERAEHVMLVDLGRNDLGRVSRYGSVKVNRFMEVEKYSHVQHIISEVGGELGESEDSFSALKSVFPAGTVSGAPKVRAMQIIDELEPTRRGVYAGCIGYFSFNGNMDTAITIRTIDFEGDKAHIQVGAGIVADSLPEKEYDETMSKGEAMLKALGVGK